MSTLTMNHLSTTEVRAALGAGFATDEPILHWTTDSRAVKKGSAFVALRGQRHDGNKFALQAIEAGAALVIASLEAPEHSSIVRVADPLAAMGRCAALLRARFEGPVLGITGSAGKTTLKEFLRALIPADWHATFPESSHNNAEGLPRTMLATHPDARCMVLELGTNAPGEIAALAAIAKPTLAALTSIGPAHLEGLGSVEGVLQEKLDLVRALPRGSTVFLNADDPRLSVASLPAGLQVLHTGLHNGVAPLRPALASDAQCFVLEDGTRIAHTLDTDVLRRALWMALQIALHLGVPKEHLVSAAQHVHAHKLRGETRRLGPSMLVLDCYNANPLSMSAALAELAKRPAPRRVVLGDMRELGEGAEEAHRAVGRQLAQVDLAEALLIGTYAPHVAESAHAAGIPASAITICPDTASAAAAFRMLVARGGTVLMKASRGMALERLLEGSHD
jgi:UDP-N-acetylmuramoyl-tripeptide--D-alanyl-D-alanine ligase